MRKIIVSTMITIDGVQEDPHLWSFDYMTEELRESVTEQLFATDTLVMGRVTYEGFAASWGSRDESDPFTKRINSLPKYVASRTLKDPLTWNATLIKGNVGEEIAHLKQQEGQDILQYGMGELTYTMLEHGLVDEVRLYVYPVAVGSGGRIFENVDKTSLQLIESTSFGSGVVGLRYQPLNATKDA